MLRNLENEESMLARKHSGCEEKKTRRQSVQILRNEATNRGSSARQDALVSSYRILRWQILMSDSINDIACGGSYLA
jgi:hypothetical protein